MDLGGDGNPTAIPKVDIGPVWLILARGGAVYDDIGMTIMVDVTQDNGLKLPVVRMKIHRTTREASPPIAVIDVDPQR
jgi:hypothetical protein